VPRYRFTETAKKLVTENWGRINDSSDEAVSSHLKTLDASGLCLMLLANRVEKVIEALTCDYIREQAEKAIDKRDKIISEWISEREARHGKCPDSVRRDLRMQFSASMGWTVLVSWSLDSGFSPSIPELGTRARKDYDAWMRRKPKSAASK
jgi:hypothetical protein